MHSVSSSPRPAIDTRGEVFAYVLGDPLRRRLVEYIGTDQHTLSHLAEVFTAWTCVNRGVTADARQRFRMKIYLYHAVLPRFEDLDLVEFDVDERVVTGRIDPEIVDLTRMCFSRRSAGSRPGTER